MSPSFLLLGLFKLAQQTIGPNITLLFVRSPNVPPPFHFIFCQLSITCPVPPAQWSSILIDWVPLQFAPSITYERKQNSLRSIFKRIAHKHSPPSSKMAGSLAARDILSEMEEGENLEPENVCLSLLLLKVKLLIYVLPSFYGYGLL